MYRFRCASSFKLGISESGHVTRWLKVLIENACVFPNLHGISRSVHKGGGAILKENSDFFLTGQKKYTLNSGRIGFPKLLKPTFASLA